MMLLFIYQDKMKNMSNIGRRLNCNGNEKRFTRYSFRYYWSKTLKKMKE